MSHKRFFLLFVSLSVLVLSGCWSKKELTELALVSAIGIDKNEDGKYVGTLQVINPGNVAGVGQGGGAAPPISVYTATGENIVDVSRNASTKVSRRMYYAHTNLVVVSDELAEEEGIQPILDAIERDPNFRTTATVVIAKDVKAGDIVRTLTPIDKISANKIIKTLEYTEKVHGYQIKVTMQELIRSLVTPGREPMLTGVIFGGDPQKSGKMENLQETEPLATLELNGLAMFKNGKLVDWLQEDKARGAIWIRDKIKSTDIDVDWEEKKEVISFEVSRQKTDVSVQMKDRMPKINISTEVEGDIGEARVPLDLTKGKTMKKIEKKIEKEIKTQLEATVEQAQENKTDILGFGEAVHRSKPKDWKRLQSNWSDVYFPELEVSVEVNAFVRRTGIRNNSYLSNLEE
ncbi:Ger(x)C family spore germination protein [Bacillus seohaeanensis]|jgi:spore germination protein KC|uniref:Ger(X)C family spore germination protein n=1 Tax=Bacillus seohaeanensis TaxID=284580 RepID=A0ABW5RWL1_9BACI